MSIRTQKIPLKGKRLQWTNRQNLDYYMFLIIRFNQCSVPTKKSRIFKQMAEFILTKTSNQCRSHHQKMIGKSISNSNSYQEQVKILLQEYFQSHFCERQVDLDQLNKEIRLFLWRAKKLNKSLNIEQEEQNLNESLNLLGFEGIINDYRSQMDAKQKGQVISQSAIGGLEDYFEPICQMPANRRSQNQQIKRRSQTSWKQSKCSGKTKMQQSKRLCDVLEVKDFQKEVDIFQEIWSSGRSCASLSFEQQGKQYILQQELPCT